MNLFTHEWGNACLLLWMGNTGGVWPLSTSYSAVLLGYTDACI